MPNSDEERLIAALSKFKWATQRAKKELDDMLNDLEQTGQIDLVKGTHLNVRAQLIRNHLLALIRETQLQIQRETR